MSIPTIDPETIPAWIRAELAETLSNDRVNRLLKLLGDMVTAGLLTEAQFVATLNTDFLTEDEFERARQMWSA